MVSQQIDQQSLHAFEHFDQLSWVHLLRGSHFSSPVVCDSFTVENRSGRGSPPSTPAAASTGGCAQ